MSLSFLKPVRASLVLSLVIALVVPQMLQAQSQIVQSSELAAAIQKAAASRRTNLEQVRSFFSSKPVRAALSKSTMTPEGIDKAAVSLSDEDLAKLAQKTQKIQADFAAGAMSNQDLTYVVIALGAAVLVLVIVAAK
jgi:hypothetical protein